MKSRSPQYRFDAQNPMVVGGQAVIEGVMMRAPGMIATAVRRPDGTIAVRKDAYATLGERWRAFKLPVLRGAAGLIEMLIVGLRSLNYSAEMALASAGPDETSPGQAGKRHSDDLKLALTLAVALAAALAIFFVTPLLITTLWFDVSQQPLAFNLIAGGIRLALFLAYLMAIAMMRDVKRLFEYHGAEHKAVFAFENGDELSPDGVMGYTRFHPRCGTSFLLVVMVVAILLFGLVDTGLILWLGRLSLPVRIAVHLPLIPLLGGISYEFIRVSARHADTAIGKLVVAPGLWLQRITTREPDRPEMEVAVAALRAALGRDQEVDTSYERQAAAL